MKSKKANNFFIFIIMSDSIKHECGIALLRLLKPLQYYRDKYGSYFWDLQNVFNAEKQHNRGQMALDLPALNSI